MNKPQLCLSLAFSLALLQANLLHANASPASPAIWEKLAGVKSTDAHSKVSQKPVVKQIAVAHKVRPAALAGTYNAAGVTTSGASGQVMLFFGKDKDATGSKAPAAALTIHSSMPEQEPAPAVSSEPQPKLVAMDNAVATDAAPIASSLGAKQLLAQLAPDQIMSGAETATTPIPPVVSGTVDLEEFKPSNTIDLKVSQSRTFKLRNKIIRTSISDPAIAEPVVVAENQMVMLGKAPGGATLVIWDDAGNSVALDIKVSRDYTQLQSMLREIDPRIIVKPFSVGGADRVILMGDVDHAESVIRSFAVANAFMDDRGINITVANSRILGQRLGEQGGSTGGGAQQAGALSAIGQVDRYTFFGNQNNNVAKAQTMISDGGRVTSLIQIRKTPLIVLHTTFMEMNSASARELGLQLGIGFTNQSFGFSIGGNPSINAAPGGLLASSPGINGTFGTQLNPNSLLQSGLGGASSNSNFTTLANVLGGGAPGINILQNPAAAGGFLSQPFFQAPGKNQFFGASTAPVNFLTSAGLGAASALGLGVINGPPTLLAGQSLFGNPGGATFISGDLANMFQAVSNFASGNSSRWSVNPTVQGTIGYSRARVLAEPTLVTISGERASFLAGGEIPILQSIATAGTAAQSVVFEPYGLRLNMIPVLLENGTINLQVSPEERLLDRVNAFTLPANAAGTAPSVIPAFVTRKCQTTVELKPGQELFISGLVSQNSGRTVQKTPMLGEVPVLGALYRSKAFAKNESELIIAVRPEVILPGSPGQLKIPGELNKMEGVRDTNILQVEPSVIDESQYRSGLVEKSFQIPNTLPAGAPIPDSK